MGLRKLTVTFEVIDDLTSEQQRAYKQVICDALTVYLERPFSDTTSTELELASKLLNDWEK